MGKYSIKRLLLCALVLIMLGNLGCAAKRTAGWEREEGKVEGDAAQLIQEADKYWAQRSDVAKLEKSIELYEQAARIDQNNLDLFVALTRANYFLADSYFTDDKMKDRQIATYDKGLSYGEKAMALDPEFKKLIDSGEKVEDALRVLDKKYVGAIYWSASNLGKWALRKGLATILANKERGRKMMQRCVELDENYFYGGPHRWFGTYYAKLPAIAGRDLEKSKEHFEKAIQIESNYFGTRVLRAEYYATNSQDKNLFKKDLEFVVNSSSDVIPGLVPEQNVEKKKANELLSMINEKFIE